MKREEGLDAIYPPKELTAVDLFCGCGGLSCGYSLEGFSILLGADIDPMPLRTFKRNFSKARIIQADLSEVAPSTILRSLNLAPNQLDVLLAGPPCQGFSKNVPASRRFLDDPRNQLMRVFLKFVGVLLPKVVLMENVAELVRAYDGAVTNEILGEFQRLRYKADVKILSSVDYGVPQRRRRAFFFANRLGRPVSFPEPTHVAPDTISRHLSKPTHVTVWDAISDLPRLQAGQGSNPMPYSTKPNAEYQKMMRKGATLLYDHVARPLTAIQLERISSIKEGQGAADLPKRLQPRMGYSGAYGRLKAAGVAPTITRWVFHPGSGRFSHPYDNRVITIREAARLQSFPDTFVFEGTYIQKSRQVGEAVPPLLAAAFARGTKRILNA